jgi:predicted tellurium resistance membrane protein TerC
MNNKLGLFIVIAIIIAVVSLKIAFGILGFLLSKVGIVIIVCAFLYFFIAYKLETRNESRK